MLEFYVLRPSVAHDLAAAYAFSVIGRSYVTRKEFRRVVCPKLGICKQESKAVEKDLVKRKMLIPVPHGSFRLP